MAEQERVSKEQIIRVWDRERQQWLDWVAGQAWRADEVGALAREIMTREPKR